MTKTIFSRTLTFGFLLAGLMPAAHAVEPAQEFLDGLRERGYFDMAIEYLDSVEKNPSLFMAEFREVVLFEKGVTLIDSSRLQRDITIREKQLDQAKAALDEFIKTRQTHPLKPSAEGKLANLLVERARINIERSKNKGLEQAEADRLLGEARKMFDEAHAVFSSSQADLKEKLERIQNLDPENPAHKRLIEIRDRYRTDYLQARLLIPAIEEEKADTYPEGSEERTKLLNSAAAQYAQAYEDYRTRIAGLYARMYQGRCYVKLKNYKEALSYFGDILSQPDDPAFRDIKQKTLILAVDCWFNDEQTKYADAIAKIKAVLDTANTFEARQPEWLFLKLSLAKAYKAYADDLEQKPNKTNEDKKAITLAMNSAQSLATEVTRLPSEYQEVAREWIAKELGGRDYVAPEKGEPENFVDARTAGKETLDDVETWTTQAQTLKAELAATQDAAKKKELTDQIVALIEQIKAGPSKATDYFRQALEFADADTPTEDVNVVRYFLCYLYYTQERYYDAAIMGEFLARRYPSSSGARQSAKIAMAAYLNLYKETQNAGGNPEFEIDRIVSIADYIIESWGGQNEAIEAASTLIVFMIKSRKIDKALEYLETIPQDSPGRGLAELQIGQSLWSSYLRGMQEVRKMEAEEDKDQAAIDAERAKLEPLKKQAEDILIAGIEGMRAREVDATLASAALSLSQLYVDIGKTDEALALLEDKDIGPYSLSKQKHPATQGEGERAGLFEIETYKTALRAYISALKAGDQGQKDEAKKNAREVMTRLSAKMGDTPEGKQKLVYIYIGLATDLGKQMKEIDSEAEKQLFADGVADFLGEVQKGSDELNVLTWSADTLSNMGEAFNDPMASNKYYAESIKAFKDILAKGEAKGEGWLDPEVKTQILMRLAMTQRNTGDFKNAIENFTAVLLDRNSMLNVQAEAARTYQLWAQDLQRKRQPGADTLYGRAISGHHKDDRETVGGEKNKNLGKNVIWGWLRLAQITARYPEYRDVFHEACLNMATCRFEYGKLKDSTKYIEMAKKDISSAEKASKDLGGLKKDFDDLLAKINAELKRRQ